MTLASIRQLVADDAHALTFQTFGQYRTALLKAIDQASPDTSSDPARDLAEIYDAFRVGAAARSFHILRENLCNVLRREQCLAAIERTFFMVPTEPQEEDGGEPGEECLLNWGQDPAQYVEAFRQALKTIGQQQAGEQEDYRDGVNVDALAHALTLMGIAGCGREEMAARMSQYVNYLTRGTEDYFKKWNASREEASAANTSQKALRDLVDRVWGHAHEDQSVPSTETTDKLIAAWRDATSPAAAGLTDADLGAAAYKGFDDYWIEDSPGKERDAWTASAKAVLKLAQPSASVSEPMHALKWCAAALQALVDSRGESGAISMVVSGEKKSLQEVLDLADTALSTDKSGGA